MPGSARTCRSFTLISGVPEIEGLLIDISQTSRRAVARETQAHLIDQGADAIAGEHSKPILGSLADLRDARQRVFRLILDTLHGGDLLEQAYDQVHAHIALALNYQR